MTFALAPVRSRYRLIVALTLALGASALILAAAPADRARGSGSNERGSALDTLPEPVRRAVRAHAPHGEIADISQRTENGRKVYELSFREPMRNPRMVIADDGTIVAPLEKPPVTGIGTTFRDVPVAVQNAIGSIRDPGEIVRISREVSVRGPTVYVVDWKEGLGVFQIRISEDGKFLGPYGIDQSQPYAGSRE
jgi:hypothetical protein